ncbi:MAG: hydroxymethylbilane synthase [Pseudobdellovibrionaceae bacterium]|nr:hydroxymethylbilane synthase [Bdellovibrionales bacterium]USN48709.1 MAG: hydroxymethylbilane synthase [Pseudobdellovibrionaceae bacterium]
MLVRLASRKSDLARLQAYSVGEALKKKFPDIQIEYKFSSSLGDRDQQVPLWAAENKGLFTQDFAEDLEAGRVDAVVHSWKDLPIEMRPHTEVVATLSRADHRDLLLIPKAAWAKAVNLGQLTVLSSSPRRVYNLSRLLPNILPAPQMQIQFKDVRGNIPTRLNKLMDGEGDALVVAKAAMDRLLEASWADIQAARVKLREQLDQCHWMVLPASQNPTAAAQGAIAIEILKTRDDLRAIFAKVNCAKTFTNIRREREWLAGLGGGCHQKIGVNVLSRPYGEITYLQGLTDRGEILNAANLETSARPVWPGPTNRDEIWPYEMNEVTLFNRIPMSDVEIPSGPLWVARADALPEAFVASMGQVIWTAGLHTWQKLALRGVWVNGSAEGLGEQESENIENLLGGSMGNWTKLSHHRAESTSEKTLCPTYELQPRAERFDFTGKKYFFWPSGTAFLRAIEIEPQIRQYYHACGPGHTFGVLKQHISDSSRIRVYLSHAQWREDVLS